MNSLEILKMELKIATALYVIVHLLTLSSVDGCQQIVFTPCLDVLPYT